MSKDKKYKNIVLITKSKNSNNSINNLEWVSYEKKCSFTCNSYYKRYKNY